MPTYHVAPPGAGGLDGTSLANAWASVNDVTGIVAGDTVVCHKTGTDTLSSGQYLKFPVGGGASGNVISAYSAEAATDTYSPGYIIDCNSAAASAIQMQNYVWLRGFDLRNNTAAGDIIYGNSASSIWIDQCICRNGGRDHIGTTIDDHNLITNCTFINPARYAFNSNNSNKYLRCHVVGGANGCVIKIGTSVEDTIFENITGYAVYTSGGDIMVRRCVFYTCGTGIQVVNAWGGFFENIFHTCTTGMLVNVNVVGTEDYNVFYNNGTDTTINGRLYSGGNSITGGSDPLTNPSAGDFSRVTGTGIINTPATIKASFYEGVQSYSIITAGIGIPDSSLTKISIMWQ